jgi:hypothetical protein
MQLELIRTYDPKGTNGKIFFNDGLMMYSIELPWKDNRAGVSCTGTNTRYWAYIFNCIGFKPACLQAGVQLWALSLLGFYQPYQSAASFRTLQMCFISLVLHDSDHQGCIGRYAAQVFRNHHEFIV